MQIKLSRTILKNLNDTIVEHSKIQLLPESARYLVAAGEKDRALSVLQKAAKINKASLPKGTLTVSKSVRHL